MTVVPAIPRIHALSPLVASQIAAGEVVERPASVIKELIENSIDARATAITVELEQGGIELIRITDNGCGIERADLPLAVSPHATSKVASVEDLDHVATLGFRGEALASIASVSRLSIRSRTASDPAGGAWQLDAEGRVEGLGESDIKPAAGPVGTSITVRNLFFNTPARRKFLRTVPTEQSRCIDTVMELAISHPGLAFVCKAQGRTVLEVPANQTPRDRALDVLGRELGPELLDVSADQYDDARGVSLWGLVGLPSIARATRAAQHLFVNGRAVRDRTIQHALSEPFRGIIEPGRHPTAVLMIEMSPAGVDVNVHPQKAEVRFRDSGVVHSVVYHAVKRALTAADLTASFQSLRPQPWRGDPRAIMPAPDPASRVATLADAATTQVASTSFVDYFKRFTRPASHEPMSFEAIRKAVEAAPFEAPPAAAASTPTGTPSTAPSPAAFATPAAPPSPAFMPTPASRLLQVHNSFVVTQDEQGVLIVDQHALHERVMFESLLARVTQSDLESQRLLTPVVVDAAPAQVVRLDELAPLLSRIGVEASPLSPRQVAVHAFPTFLFDRRVEPAEFLTDLFDKASASDFVPGSEDALRDVLDMMACKAAVKAGDRMSDSELHELMRLRDAVERSSNCPHGRPTTVRLSIRELERLFGRG